MVLQGSVWLVSGFDDRGMYGEYLRHHALEVEEWETPELALHQFETSRPDVVVIDFGFPGESPTDPSFIRAVRDRVAPGVAYGIHCVVEGARRPFTRFLGAGGDHDERAVSGQRERGLLADAPARAGHHCHFARENPFVGHAALLVSPRRAEGTDHP